MRTTAYLLAACLLACFLGRAAHAEDGHELWLRYRPVEAPWLDPYRAAATQLVAGRNPSPALAAAQAELTRGLQGLLGVAPPLTTGVTADGAIVFGTPASSAVLSGLHLRLDHLGPEGYLLETIRIGSHKALVIAANSDAGVLYGTFHFLRLLQTRQAVDPLQVTSAPRIQHRVLNHWDNLDGFVERGYAGASIWDWQKLPDYLDPRYTEYARACASVGINGTVLNNVNASAWILTPLYLRKIAALAGVLRPYGLRVYLSARFSAPREIG